MLNNIKIVFITLLFVFTYSACGDASKDKPIKVKAEESTKVVIPYEDYNDTEQWSEPRLQFTRDTRELGFTVYSSKTDGTDLRIAYSLKKLTGDKDASSNYPLVRSPNSRYLAGNVARQIVLIDLHKQTHEIIMDGYGVPSFVWSKDSNRIYFFASGDLKRYNLKSKKLDTLPDEILANQLYLLKDQKIFLSAVGLHISWYDIKTGKETKKRLDLREIMSGNGRIKVPGGIKGSDLSSDETHLFFRNKSVLGVVNVKTGQSLFFLFHGREPKKGKIRAAVFLNEKELIYADRGLYVMNIFTQKRTLISRSDFNGRQIALINKKQTH